MATTRKPKLAEIKTKATTESVEDFLDRLPDGQKKADALALLALMKKITGEAPVLWGSSIIGFGNKIYESPATGRQVDWFRLGFSPRKANLTIYIMDTAKHAAALQQLGKHKTGGGCLYINKLADIDFKVLEEILKAAY